MKCLKCGRETDQTFCADCRAEMEKYPVKPGTIILLPKERTPIQKPSPRHARPSLESVVKAQKKTIRRMGRAIVILLVLMAVMTVFLVCLLNNDQQIPLGKNYSTITRPVTETTEPFRRNQSSPPHPLHLSGILLPCSRPKQANKMFHVKH